MPSVALVTCAELPGLDVDDQSLITPLRERGITPVPAVWSDPSIDWDAFDLTVIRSAWDYQDRHTEFVEWLPRVPRLHNPASILAWNTDKRYLGELAGSAVPVVPTTWMPPAASIPLPSSGEWVLKPAVGAGSRDAGRYDMSQTEHRELAATHLERLHAKGITVMAQPYLDDVDANGERALIYLGGKFSHSIRKSAMLDGPCGDEVELFKPERITPVEATAEERRIGDAALAAVPGDSPLLYARVDVVSHGGELLVLELELSEPSLFFGHAPGSADTMANAIAALL